MTSATTSASGRRAPARLATSSLLALAMMLGACSAPAAQVRQVIAEAQVKVQAVDEDLHRLGPEVATLPDDLRSAVVDAVASAEAATGEARSALARAAEGTDGAIVALADAQVALDAASAELRYAVAEAEAAGVEVTAGLERLARQIDDLRGETSRAGA